MGEHPIENLMITAMNSIQNMVDVNTIVGEPIQSMNGITIIPISKVSFGFAAGGSEFTGETIKQYRMKDKDEEIEYKLPFGGGAGAGVSINPVAFLVVQGDNVKLMPVDHQSCIDRLIDYVPDLMQKINEMFNKSICQKDERTKRILEDIKKKNCKKSDCNKNQEKKGEEVKKQDEKITPEMQEEIDKIDDKLNTIQFDNNYEVDYKNIPTIIDLKKPPVVPADGKKRILFILPWTAIGGAEIFDFNLIKGLKQKNYEISVITTQKTEHDLRQEIEQYVEEYFDLSTFLKKKDWASFVAYIIKSRRINLVFFSNSYYGYYALPWLKCQFKEIPFVDYIHSENWTLRNGGKPKDSNAVADYLDATYTCTEYLKNLMYKTMKRNVKNVKTVYIGTDTDYFNPEFESEKYDELKEKYKGKKVILLPCRIVHAKRPIFAINVIKKLAEIRDDVRLAIVGDGVALKDVKNYIIENNLQNIVECFGYQKDVRPFYKVASATIICSLQEGLALVAYESMAMGVPVVSANIGGQSELIDEECGALVPVYQKLEEQLNFNYSDEEIEKYVTKFLEIFDKLENTDIKEKCREKVVNGFSISKMINTMDKEFTRLIKSGSKIDKNLLKNVELAERYLLVHGVLESKDEREKR